MNRKKKEKSMLRKEGNVYVLDLFVKMPPGAVAPTKSRTRPWRLTQSIKLTDGREQRKGVTVDCDNPHFLTAQGVSVEDRSKRNWSRKTAIWMSAVKNNQSATAYVGCEK